MKLIQILVMAVALLASLTSTKARAGEDQIFPVIGLSAASRSGLPARAGADLALLYGRHSDATLGMGVVMSVPNQAGGEFYIGPAFGLFYMASVWIEAAAHVKRDKVTRVRATTAVGLFLMPFVSVGYDKENEVPMVEGGIMLKVPFAT
jgi:hypothetical protein